MHRRCWLISIFTTRSISANRRRNPLWSKTVEGYRADILRRVLCFALFWHTLDIIWVAIFTVVYLFGAGA